MLGFLPGEGGWAEVSGQVQRWALSILSPHPRRRTRSPSNCESRGACWAWSPG